MKYKITLNDKVFEVEVEDGEAMLLETWQRQSCASSCSAGALTSAAGAKTCAAVAKTS